MSNLYNSMRNGASPAKGVPAFATVALNNSNQELGPAVAGHRVVVDGGAIVAAADCTVTVRSGGAAGTILLTLPLAARMPVPLSLFGLFSDLGENLHIVTTDAVAVTGRVLTRSA